MLPDRSGLLSEHRIENGKGQSRGFCRNVVQLTATAIENIYYWRKQRLDQVKKYFPRVSIWTVYTPVQFKPNIASKRQSAPNPSISISTPKHQNTTNIIQRKRNYFKRPPSSITFCTASASHSNSSLRLISRSSSPSVSSFPKSQVSFMARVRERMSSAARTYA